jgi:hypothetical protein
MLDRVPDWKSYLSKESDDELVDSIKRYSSSGRPAGDEKFVNNLKN